MRVLFASTYPHLPAIRGGLQTTTHDLCLAILEAGASVTAVEIDHNVACALTKRFVTLDVRCADFLTLGDLGLFDVIVMNPPFRRGSDIKHIQHAATKLAPGGRLVAICANGPRQQDALQPIASQWHELPAGSFKSEGTNVNTAIVVIDN